MVEAVLITDRELCDMGPNGSRMLSEQRKRRLLSESGAQNVSSGVLRTWRDEATCCFRASVSFDSSKWTGRAGRDRFKNPTFHLKATERRLIWVCRGDMVDVDTDSPMTTEVGGSLRKDSSGQWNGTAAHSLRPTTAEELDWVPPHLRLLNRIFDHEGAR